MAYSQNASASNNSVRVNHSQRRPRVLLAACGSVDAVKFGKLCHYFPEWSDVRAVATRSSLHFIDRSSLPRDVILYTDEDDWSSWRRLGDTVLHIELSQWADILVIAPLSANTLAKIAGGMCDNLLTCIVRAWNYTKPLFVAPGMNTYMYQNPFTEQHIMAIDDTGIAIIPSESAVVNGDYEVGAMASPSAVYSAVRVFLDTRV